MSNHERTASDRLVKTGERASLLEGSLLSDFLHGSLELVVADVVPGQPITVRWRVVLGLGDLGDKLFRLRVHIAGFVYERQDIPARDATVGPATLAGTRVAAPAKAGWQDETIVLPPNIARSVYRVPGNQFSKAVRLTADVRTDVSGRTFGGLAWFRVKREPLGYDWQWRVPDFEVVAWKDAYALLGDFVNLSQFSSMVVSAHLHEADSPNDPCEAEPAETQDRINAVQVRGRSSFRFVRTQDWHWIRGRPTFIIDGPMERRLTLAVSIRCSDEFGNAYGACSSEIVRKIEVSVGKKLAGIAAMTGAMTAAGLLISAAAALASIIFAAAAPALFKAAAYAYAAAEAAHHAAEDPPNPDPRYQDPVEVVPLPMAEWPSDVRNEALTALRSLFETAGHLLALEKARTVSRARLMGAELANDAEALERQRDGYLRIEREIIETGEKLGEILPHVERAVEEDPSFDPENAEPWLDAIAQGGFSASMQKVMTDAKIGAAEINSLAALLRDPQVVELVRANGLFLRPFVVSLQSFAAAVQEERDMVLAGGTFGPLPKMSRQDSSGHVTGPPPTSKKKPRR